MTGMGVVTLDDIASGQRLTDGDGLIQIQSGFYLGRTDMPLGDGIMHVSEAFPFVGLSILLEGRVDTDVPDMGRVDPNAALIVSHNERRQLSSHLHGAPRLRNVEVFVTQDWFDLPGNRLVADPAFQEMRAAMDRPLVRRQRALDPRLRDTALSVLAPAVGGAVTALQLEATALDMLASLAATYRGLDPLNRLLSRDRDRMFAVRDAIEANPGSVASLASLAAAYGISASKLKRDFFLTFSTCVGGFVNEQRLAMGCRLIEQGMSVSQAAYTVGYAHPTNFSAAFKRRYGVSPRTARG